MTPVEFTFTANFPTLTELQIQSGIDAVEAQYYGALLFWSKLPEDIKTKKRTLLENYLVAWYLANMFPLDVVGVVTNGGLPLSAKSIEQTSLSFLTVETQDAMKPLLSNTFGLQALSMMMAAPERFTVYG